ncbi:3-keto-disaccharide hydrolase [Pontiella sulfatireligans]|uniref:3-keto-alpha-glucoside-1,2-lyase/3-keto-2-hydroxy-glucal hydratase domain-containing protein n=1 Tax=Pontiella sulfatireligans TaxID=2750658 RepID=A0A6C2UGJ2_9BACT|nr:DUF1080 domain-containing protein [Pontiella sulfatireligans]VGO19295.1 hypothetical protein SCARR_01353 [Pontiella sulfatireligans]
MKSLILTLSICSVLMTSAAKPGPTPVYMSEAEAAGVVPNFKLIGEYLAKSGGTAVQANLLKDGDFLVATYQGGLPGDGWDQSPIKSEKLAPEALKTLIAGYAKAERSSPTLGMRAPDGAVLVFPDDFSNIKDGLLMAGGKTLKDLSSFSMHLEFMQPLKPGKNPSSQDRGNSGIYIFNNYEIQVIDTFALDYENPDNNAIKTESLNKQWCGSLYKQKLPDVNMTYPPLRWQTYDIDFQAPEFEGGKKVKNARITLFHNGVKVHDDFELKTGTGNGAKKPQLAKGPVFFQNHGNPVVYRNVWATEL